jgi:hypothetical protein
MVGKDRTMLDEKRRVTFGYVDNNNQIVGIAIFYGSIAIAPLQFHVYPPYGLITEAFIPLGSYLLFIGIFTSAKHISRDSEVRKELY